MPELDFVEYIKKHKRKCFAIRTAPSNGPLIRTNANNQEFPSPHQLLSKWCTSYLKNDWAILERSNDLLLVVQSSDEEKQLREMLTISHDEKPVITEAGHFTYSAKYGSSEY